MKLFYLTLALVLAFALNEIIVRYVFNYPAYGVSIKINGIRSSEGGSQNIYFPYSSYCDVEGGNRVFRRNNLGLFGIDVKISPQSKYVMILGNSFIEATQIPPDSTSTSLLERKLARLDPALQVINLGFSGQDPYDNYLRLAFYEQIYKPYKIVLVLTSSCYEWLNRHPYPFDFNKKKDFWKIQEGPVQKAEVFLRNNFCSINLICSYLKHLNGESEIRDKQKLLSSKAGNENEEIHKLIDCLEAFNKKYEENFLCLSIISDSLINRHISEACEKKGIHFVYDNTIRKANNLIGGKGHLNTQGNEILEEFLLNSFEKYYF